MANNIEINMKQEQYAKTSYCDVSHISAIYVLKSNSCVVKYFAKQVKSPQNIRDYIRMYKTNSNNYVKQHGWKNSIIAIR